MRAAARGRARRWPIVRALPLLLCIGLGASACTTLASHPSSHGGFDAYDEAPYAFGLPGAGDFDFNLDGLVR
jgi:hypothetical protein